MRTAIATIALCVLAGCSGSETPQPKPKAEEKGSFTLRRAIPDTVKGEERQRLGRELVDRMADNPDVDVESYKGEAWRHGVTPTAAQIARKAASYRPTVPTGGRR